jgi:hypothetical protein
MTTPWIAKKSAPLLLVALAVGLVSTSVKATSYTVDDAGAIGAGGCTIGIFRANTHIDLSNAVTAARNDASVGPHTIYVCNGAYSETGAMAINNNNMIGLTVEGESLAGAVITGAAADIFDVQRDGITFRNITTNAGRYAFETNTAGTNFTLDNVTINNTTNDALRLNASNVVLTDVTINTAGNDGIQANATVDGTFTATDLTISDTGGYCARLRGGEPDTLVSLTTTRFTNCGSMGLRTEAAADELTIDDIQVNGTGNNHCVFIQGGDNAANGNVIVTNAVLTDCGNGGTDSGLFITVTNGAGGAMVDVSDITVINSQGRGVYINNARANTAGDVVIDDISVTGTVNAEGVYLNNCHLAQVTDLLITDAGTDGLYVRSGDFMTLGVIDLAQNIVSGSGDEGIYLSNQANDNTLNNFRLDNNSDDAIGLNNSRRNVFTDIVIDQMNTGQDGVTIANNANNNDFDNVDVSNTTGDCVRIDDGNNIDYINATLTNCADYGFDASPVAETGLYLDNVNISNTRNHGLYVRNYAAGNMRLFNLAVTNAGGYVPGPGAVVNGARGIWIDDSSGVQLRDFVITDTLGDGLVLDNADNTVISISGVSPNVISGAGDALNENGFEFVTGADNNAVSNINIINTFDDAMRLTASSNNVIANINITNPAGDSNDGIVVINTATGNSFATINIEAVADDCFATNATGTSVTTALLSDCIDMGLVASLNPIGVGTLDLADVSVSGTGDDGINITNYQAGSAVNVTDISIANSADIGMTISATDDGSFTDLDIQNSTRFGIAIINSDNNTFGVNTLVKNIIDGNEDGVQLQTGSNGNSLSDFIISNSNDDGLIFTTVTNNTFQNSEVVNNGDVGITITTTSVGNVVSDNLVLENANFGARIFNTGTSSANVFTDNCFRNIANADDNETGAVNNFDNGVRGNFWGSLLADGSGYSESCADRRIGAPPLDDDICDTAYPIPNGGGSSDNFPLQFCSAFDDVANLGLNFSKMVLTVNDPINTSNYKAIPGATIRYTLSVTNNPSSGVRSGMAKDLVMTDDFDARITTDASLLWGSGSMIRTAPDYNSGAASVLTDADASDDNASFNVVGPNQVNVSCGDLNASETCTLTFQLDIN